MSVFTDMSPALLQVSDKMKGSSGALKDVWVDVGKLDIAIYDNDAFKSTQSVKYEQSTHTGCTYFKELDHGKGYRIVQGMYIYVVTSFNTSGRITTLLLKRTLYAE